MTAPVTIRPFASGDRQAWEPLWSGYLSFDEVTEATWQRLLDKGEDMHGLGAFEEDGTLVGIVHYLYHPVTWSIAPRCYLEDLFVSETARGNGAGRALIEAVYAAADQRGADQVYWLTEETNHTARKLYDRLSRRTAFIKYQR